MIAGKEGIVMPGTRTSVKPQKKTTPSDRTSSKKALVAAIKGKYAWVPYSSEDFNRDKRREIALEDRA